MLCKLETCRLIEAAIETLSAIFDTETSIIRGALVEAHTHNWINDPFTYGAYSYTPVGMMQMPELLRAPIENTLFFAGEATASPAEQGTVNAALDSGVRCSREILNQIEAQRLEAVLLPQTLQV
jgi:monoamine oxidase